MRAITPESQNIVLVLVMRTHDIKFSIKAKYTPFRSLRAEAVLH